MTKLEIIDQAIEHIKQQGRAFKPVEIEGKVINRCVYYTAEGLRCVHSIFVEDDIAKGAKGSAVSVINEHGDKCHKPEFRGHSVEFWQNLQYIHDDADNWKEDNKMLSEIGEKRLHFLKEKYS